LKGKKPQDGLIGHCRDDWIAAFVREGFSEVIKLYEKTAILKLRLYLDVFSLKFFKGYRGFSLFYRWFKLWSHPRSTLKSG
jgi:hypothetical protein